MYTVRTDSGIISIADISIPYEDAIRQATKYSYTYECVDVIDDETGTIVWEADSTSDQ